ncbi:FeoB-associated Cys-rich membrane protein [Enterococcus olivae]
MTIVLSILIFGSVAWIIYRQVKGDSHCNDCPTSCTAKQEHQNK